jgi:hypothetical protein
MTECTPWLGCCLAGLVGFGCASSHPPNDADLPDAEIRVVCRGDFAACVSSDLSVEAEPLCRVLSCDPRSVEGVGCWTVGRDRVPSCLSGATPFCVRRDVPCETYLGDFALVCGDGPEPACVSSDGSLEAGPVCRVLSCDPRSIESVGCGTVAGDRVPLCVSGAAPFCMRNDIPCETYLDGP